MESGIGCRRQGIWGNDGFWVILISNKVPREKMIKNHPVKRIPLLEWSIVKLYILGVNKLR